MKDTSDTPKNQDEPPSLFNKIKCFFNFQKEGSLKEAIEEVLEEHPEKMALDRDEENTIFYNLLDFTELKAKDIMIPRTDIEAIEHSISLDKLKKIVLKSEHTRFPIYKGNLDHVVGFLHLKDLVPYLENSEKSFDMNAVIRKILVVPPSKKAIDILHDMRADRVHMAIVIDEYGGTDGLITLEDIFEEIVGDIQDEHDEEEEGNSLLWISDSVWEADARTDIEHLEEAIGQDLRKEEDFETIGGLIFFIAGKVPKKGDKLSYKSEGLEFDILEAEPRCVKKVRITKITSEI